MLFSGFRDGLGGIEAVPSNDDATFTPFLDPGIGGSLCQFESVTALFPSTRVRNKGLRRLGFVEDGDHWIADQLFKRFRLNKTTYSRARTRLNVSPQNELTP